VPLLAAPVSSSPTAHPDIDECSTKSGGPSWERRIPWLRNSDKHPSFESNQNVYYGDVMNMYSPHEAVTAAAASSTAANISRTDSNGASSSRSVPNEPDGVWSKIATLSKPNSARGTDMAVESFSDEEWTPQDSAYGAACPVSGCLPKHIRRGIELTLIGILIFLLVYMVVTTSIRVNADHASAKTGSQASQSLRDDDYFVETGSGGSSSATVAATDDTENAVDDLYGSAEDAAGDDDNDGQGRMLLRGSRNLLQLLLL
jgi:hypothetical protein